MARPQPRYEESYVKRGISAILLGAPGSGKGTQVSLMALSLPAHTMISDCATN